MDSKRFQDEIKVNPQVEARNALEATESHAMAILRILDREKKLVRRQNGGNVEADT